MKLDCMSNAVANAEPGLTPLSEISKRRREGCSPLMLSLEIDEIKEFISSLYIEDRR